MKITIFSILLTVVLAICVNAQQDTGLTEKKGLLELRQETKLAQDTAAAPIKWTTRKIRAVVLSSLIPGTGQTYLGNELKGVGFTLGFLGCGLGAILNHNNFVAREDRISELLAQYYTKTSYQEAEKIWTSIASEKNDRQSAYDRRKLFSYLTIAVWALNVADIVLFNDDFGATDFTFLPANQYGSSPSLAGVNKLIDFRINLF